MVKAGAQGQQAGKVSLIPVVKTPKKIKTEKRKNIRNNKSSRSNSTHFMETLPPTQKWEKWASISGFVPCWGYHTGVSTAKAALKAQKAALGSNQLSTETLTTLVSDFTSHFPKFLAL